MGEQVRWLSDDEQKLWRLMLDAERKMACAIESSLQNASDLSMAEFAVLVALSEANGGALRLRELCTSLKWNRSRASHQITRMVQRGLVSKRKASCDARGVEVLITDEGMSRLVQAAPEHVEVVRRMVFDHIDPDQARYLRDFLFDVLATEGECCDSEQSSI